MRESRTGHEKARLSALTQVALCTALISTPLAANAIDPGNGQRLYVAHCAGCHGLGGLSPLPEVPNFARGERLDQPDPILATTVRAGRGAMPPFFGLLSEREIGDIIGFLRTL